MQKIIQLKPDDDIASIRAKIESAELSHIVLVIPRGCAALENDRGLQLLRRAAEDAGVEIGLVAHDFEIRERAGSFGFPMFSSIGQAQHSRWHMEDLPRDLVQGTPKRMSFSPSEQAPLSPADRMRQWWAILAAGIVFSCVLCFFGVLFVPAANVRLVPASIALSVSTDIMVDSSIPQINNDTRSIPARRVTQEISGTMQLKTTTEKSVPNAPSAGTVTFSNMRGENTLVPQGTVVKTSAGIPIRFTTSTTVTIPAGVNSRVDAPVQAVDPGPTGNVKELQINAIEGSLSLEARVINLRPTASGSLKPVKVVSVDDKKKLETLLLQQMRQQGSAVLQKALKPNEFMPYDSVLLDMSNETYDHSVDDPADVLNLKITADIFGLAIDQADADTLIRTMLVKQMQPGYQLLPNGVKTEPQTGGKYQGIALRMPVRGIGYATPLIDANKVASALQGKTVEEATDYLSNAINLSAKPDIKVTPIGWNRFPWLGFRIAVRVEPQAVGQK